MKDLNDSRNNCLIQKIGPRNFKTLRNILQGQFCFCPLQGLMKIILIDVIFQE